MSFHSKEDRSIRQGGVRVRLSSLWSWSERMAPGVESRQECWMSTDIGHFSIPSNARGEVAWERVDGSVCVCVVERWTAMDWGGEWVWDDEDQLQTWSQNTLLDNRLGSRDEVKKHLRRFQEQQQQQASSNRNSNSVTLFTSMDNAFRTDKRPSSKGRWSEVIIEFINLSTPLSALDSHSWNPVNRIQSNPSSIPNTEFTFWSGHELIRNFLMVSWSSLMDYPVPWPFMSKDCSMRHFTTTTQETGWVRISVTINLVDRIQFKSIQVSQCNRGTQTCAPSAQFRNLQWLSSLWFGGETFKECIGTQKALEIRNWARL